MDAQNLGETMDTVTQDARESCRQEPLYGGFTRFELEVEVSVCFSVIRQELKCHAVCPVLVGAACKTSSRPWDTANVGNRGNPWYLNHLATQKLFDNPAFVAYLSYLQYFSQPEYTKYLMYPGPTLKALQLLQQEKFRQDILSPETVARMIEANLRAVAGASTATGANPSIHT